MGVCWVFHGMFLSELQKAKSLWARGGEKEKTPRSQQLISVRCRSMKRIEAGCGHKITTDVPESPVMDESWVQKLCWPGLRRERR